MNGWTVAEYDLASLNGKTIGDIAVTINASAANGNYVLKLGEIAILPANYNPAAVAVSDVKIEGDMTATDGDLRLSWSYDYNDDFDHFDIYVTGDRKSVV